MWDLFFVILIIESGLRLQLEARIESASFSMHFMKGVCMVRAFQSFKHAQMLHTSTQWQAILIGLTAARSIYTRACVYNMYMYV